MRIKAISTLNKNVHVDDHRACIAEFLLVREKEIRIVSKAIS